MKILVVITSQKHKNPFDHSLNFLDFHPQQHESSSTNKSPKKMWNGKTFPLSPSSERSLKTVIIKGQTHISYPNNIKFIETLKVNEKYPTSKISINMEVSMEKKCFSHHSA